MTSAEAAALAAQGRSGIPLTDANARASLQQRVDRKYIVDAGTFAEFTRALPHFAALEIEERRVATYRTLYFDTTERTSFRDHVQRRRRRYKTRRREYVESGMRAFEVKVKGRRGETVKRRLTVDTPLEEPRLAPVEVEFLERVVGPVVDELAPRLRVEYRRLTLVAPEAAERVTCDFDLVVRDEAGREFALDRDLLVVESKSPSGRGEADRVLRSLRVHPLRISKYVVGTALVLGRGGNDFRRAARRFESLALTEEEYE